MSAPTIHDELESERRHLTTSRAALRRMRERAEAMYATGSSVSGDPFGAESLGRALARRIAELTDDPTAPLFFGRLDFGPADEEHAGHAYHIGRRHVTDDRGEPLVLDWRAPVSRSFYRASAREPLGVAIRRRFGWHTVPDRTVTGRGKANAEAADNAAVLTSFEDEHLDRGEELGTTSSILTAEIERPRVGPMRDIVATIQPEQDDLVRADLDTTIAVQGAPGTGKTAVGLHRAAFLLYQHRERLRRTGVLIIGPNRAFLHYIAAVLPALGEIDVTQATVDDLLPVTATAIDTTEAAIVKHDARMAEVLRRALYARVSTGPFAPIEVPDSSYRWRISADALRRVVADVQREDPPYALGRERVRARVVSLLQRQAEARRAESPSDAWLRKMGKARPVADFVDAAWPAVTATELVGSVLTAPDTGGLLTPAEEAAITWARPPRSLKAAAWTAADAVLVDEAAGLLERPGGFGHVVVDEAQDLSPMQARAIARRSEHAAITLLGDLAQGTTPWAARDWESTLGHLGKAGAAVVPLTLGFRVPAAVLALANRLLPALGVDVPAARSLRGDGALAVTPVTAMPAAVVEAVAAALAFEGSVGVIAAEDSVPALVAALAAAGVTSGDAESDGRVSVLPATVAKGLEYDHVIVVEPADIVDAEPRGLHRLYVVLTRAVSRLDVLHARPLPPTLV